MLKTLKVFFFILLPDCFVYVADCNIAIKHGDSNSDNIISLHVYVLYVYVIILIYQQIVQLLKVVFGQGIDLWNSSQFAIGTNEYGSAVGLW